MAPHTRSYILRVAGDEGGVRRFVLEPGDHLVGSHPGADVRLDEAGVSRRHAQLSVLDDGGVIVRDLGSKNGTLLEGRPIRHAAFSGVAKIEFGPVSAGLEPFGAEVASIFFTPPAGAAAPPALPSGPVPPTAGGSLNEVLAASLGEVLPRLAAGMLSVEAAATALAARWVEQLPITRVDVVRETQRMGDVVLTGAGSAEGAGAPSSTLEVAEPGGLKLRLRVRPGADLSPLSPYLHLALALLAGYAQAHQAELEGAPREAAHDLPEPPTGLGEAMSAIYRRAKKVARGDVPVLILGESGVGKEVLARWLHARSRRHAGTFLAINCAALPKELLEAELFGIEKGVATGVEPRPGILERAAGGTVFLDEIGDMAPDTQAKVLRVLESTTLYRVGGRRPIATDVRFLAATNRDLAVLVETGSFRLDLYHRLAAFEVKLPPLRERREEIPALAASFFHRELEKGRRKSPGLTRAALGALVSYSWPGNVRELANELAKAVLLLDHGEPLDLAHLSERVRRATAESPAPPLALAAAAARAEAEAFRIALAAARGDAHAAMELLGVSKTTFYRKLRELGLD